MEDILQDLALGIKRAIDVATYRSGLERQSKVSSVKAPQRSIKLDELLKQRASKKEALEWYKRCMREGCVLPYFQNITGTCFLLIEGCVENALTTPLTSRSSTGLGESEEFLVCEDGICSELSWNSV